MTIGERIAKRREELGYTQEELAKKMGYSGKSIISKTENKKNDIKLKTVSRFAEALDCTESFLMGWEDVPKFEEDHTTLILKYSKLNAAQKATVMNLIDTFLNNY